MTHTTVSSSLDAALRYLSLGFVPLPIKKGSKKPLVEWGELQSRRPSESEVRAWFSQWPDANIAIVTGQISGIIALDLESGADLGDRPIPPTPLQLTGGGGKHYLFRHPGFPIANAVRILDRVDVRGDGGYIVVPPSLHPSGRRYEWVISPEIEPLAEPPEWLLALLKQRSRESKDWETIAQGVPEGERNETLASYIGKVLAGLPMELWESAGWDAARGFAARCTPPLSEREAREVFESIAKREAAKRTRESKPEPRATAAGELDQEFTDRNNALILAERVRGTALWVPAWGWLLWTGARWERDPDGSRVLALARELLPKHYLERALQASDYKERERLCEHAKRAHKRHNISNALELAKGDLRAEPKDFDQDPWLLNCSNGVLDLRTGELRPHSPELKLTKLCPVAYDPNAQAPTWERFLREIFLNDDELIRYVQRACGYSITGDVREDKLFICWGTGANGKSTFLQTLRRVLGDYAGAIAPAAIVHKGKDSHPTAVADLYALRFAIAVETDEDQRLAEAQVKALTGRDSIKARFMHRDYFEFEPRAKIWLATNHRPLIHDTSPAIWRRIALIPFRAFFPPELQDKTLGEKLWQERAGILAWLVQGCLAWQAQGLGECDVVAEATESYRSEMDALQEWLQERCEPDPKAITLFKELYDDYVSWCTETDQEPLSKRAFGNRLTEKGFGAIKKAGRVGARQGLRLREP
jgi:putative DNA primase/helicase